MMIRCSMGLPYDGISVGESLHVLLIQLAAFNVSTLSQTEGQAFLVRAFETFKVDLCCISKMRLQDPTPAVTPCSSDATSFPCFTFASQVIDFPARGQADVERALSRESSIHCSTVSQ